MVRLSKAVDHGLGPPRQEGEDHFVLYVTVEQATDSLP